MLTLVFVLLLVALGLTLATAAGKLAIWPAVFVALVALLVAFWPAAMASRVR